MKTTITTSYANKEEKMFFHCPLGMERCFQGLEKEDLKLIFLKKAIGNTFASKKIIY